MPAARCSAIHSSSSGMSGSSQFWYGGGGGRMGGEGRRHVASAAAAGRTAAAVRACSWRFSIARGSPFSTTAYSRLWGPTLQQTGRVGGMDGGVGLLIYFF